MRRLIKPVIIAALTLAFISPAAARDRWKELYSNVTVKDGYKLFNSVAFIAHFEAKDFRDAIAITWYGKDRIFHECWLTDRKLNGKTFKDDFRFMIIDAKKRKEKFPLIQYGPDKDKDKNTGFRAIRYDATDGTLTQNIFWENYWWEDSIGHLQERLPAATWTACPDFPSAKSLGAKVNAKQTATKYKKLIRQDPGRRILRPDLVTEDTVERY